MSLRGFELILAGGEVALDRIPKEEHPETIMSVYNKSIAGAKDGPTSGQPANIHSTAAWASA